MMFSKILIANRGEIACRVIRTAHRLGVATVAVYSDADISALHVEMAGEAVHIGPPSVGESYLRGDRIIAAALDTGAQAIHPGYGFLSENPDFVDAVEAAGLVFIGPSASAIRAMGLKDAAKRLMVEAGVPVVPGYHGDNQDAAFLAEQADQMGYPVLIKASAGGGGKGMRKVEAPAGFAEALASARSEARNAFGNDHVLVEKYVTKPRHIEVQVFGDGERAVHLFERDCSLQRRHQKVIEEAPAPGMTAEMREAMGSAAVRAAEAIGYAGAGTIEFIVDGSDGLRPDRFWFMEMNTRLQVEHPVTEAITGVDLVEWQLRVAAGGALPAAQEDLTIDGHAFEARIYAEDAEAGFLPATGHLGHLHLPGFARIDSGVRQGDEITPFYDPMIAKVTVHGQTRGAALTALRRALGATRIAGTVTNVSFLAALATHSGFAGGDVDTGLIERDFDALTSVPPVDAAAYALAAIAALGLHDKGATDDLWTALSGWRIWGDGCQNVRLQRGGEDLTLAVRVGPGRRFEVETPKGACSLGLVGTGEGLGALIGGRTRPVHLAQGEGRVTVFWDGQAVSFTIPDPLQSDAEGAAGGDTVIAPMTGLVRTVTTSAGDTVSEGQALLTLEAMKMEHTLRAPRDGTIAEVLVTAGDQVDEASLLIALVPEE